MDNTLTWHELTYAQKLQIHPSLTDLEPYQIEAGVYEIDGNGEVWFIEPVIH